MKTRPDLVAYGVVIVCVVGIVVLTALRVPVPDFLTFAGTTALGIGGGVSLQGVATAASAAEPAPAAPPVAADPQTGIIPRVATHAP